MVVEWDLWAVVRGPVWSGNSPPTSFFPALSSLPHTAGSLSQSERLSLLSSRRRQGEQPFAALCHSLRQRASERGNAHPFPSLSAVRNQTPKPLIYHLCCCFWIWPCILRKNFHFFLQKILGVVLHWVRPWLLGGICATSMCFISWEEYATSVTVIETL